MSFPASTSTSSRATCPRTRRPPTSRSARRAGRLAGSARTWAMGHYADVRAALRDDDLFRSGRGVAANAVANVLGRGTTISSDGDTHTARRRLLMQSLGASRLATARSVSTQRRPRSSTSSPAGRPSTAARTSRALCPRGGCRRGRSTRALRCIAYASNLIPTGVRKTVWLRPVSRSFAMSDSSLVRPYRGVAADDRIAARRSALMDAALEVFAADGWAALSARRVCEQAGLTRRYFYESFDDIDALIGAVFDRVADEVSVWPCGPRSPTTPPRSGSSCSERCPPDSRWSCPHRRRAASSSSHRAPPARSRRTARGR